MRRRMIDPDFWSDDKLASLDFTTRLVFIAAWSYADDEGIYRENYARMKAVLFPYDEFDGERSFSLKNHIEKLIKIGLIEIYDTKEGMFHRIKNFLKFQKINHPTPSNYIDVLEDSGELKRPLEDSPQVKLREVKRREGKLKEVKAAKPSILEDSRVKGKKEEF